jgi:hypothetical protein
MMIIKRRDNPDTWVVYQASLGTSQYLRLDSANGAASFNLWNNTAPTTSVFSVSTPTEVNASGSFYSAFLFASCPNVSKVGNYTGNGSSQTINMGFSGGARFFLVKRTNTTGNWWIWDTARGIVASADPALTLNTTDTEVLSSDVVDADSSGVIVRQEGTFNINVNGASYVYFAMA